MLVNITTIPARAIVQTVPAHTIVDVAYEFEDLSDEAKNRAVEDMREERLYYDMASERDFYAYEFPHSTFNMEWSAGYCQGDGVNVYGKFSMNDLLRYAGLETVEQDFYIEVEPNRTYTYCTWDLRGTFWEVYGQIESEYGYWDCDFSKVWEERVEAICEAMTRLCREIHDYMDSLAIGDGYFDPVWHEDILYDEDGTWLCDWHDFHGEYRMTVEEYEEAFK